MRAPREGPALQRGDTVEVRIEKAVHRGQGMARHQGQVVFVPGAVPGDLLRVRVVEATKGYVRGAVEALVEPGHGRRDAPCAFAARCGGCSHQAVEYATQLALKEAVLRDSLERGRVPWAGPIVMHGSPEQGWRMRAALHLEATATDLRLGLHEAGSNRVVDVEQCGQLSAAMNTAARALLQAVRSQRHWWPRLGDLVLAESLDGSRLVACLEVRGPARDAAALSALAGRVPGLSGLGVLAGREDRREYVHLSGDPYLGAEVVGERLRFHVRSFFQGNRFLVGTLVQHVVGLVPEGGSVLDLYAGVGLFAIPLARRAEEVRGAELSPFAVADAEHNVTRAALVNVRVSRGDVRQALSSWTARESERVVLDPPRTGARPDVVRAVAARRPAVVVYVSCDPATLARDLALFASSGYTPDSVTGFDLFPDTFHLETVVRLVPTPA